MTPRFFACATSIASVPTPTELMILRFGQRVDQRGVGAVMAAGGDGANARRNLLQKRVRVLRLVELVERVVTLQRLHDMRHLHSVDEYVRLHDRS